MTRKTLTVQLMDLQAEHALVCAKLITMHAELVALRAQHVAPAPEAPRAPDTVSKPGVPTPHVDKHNRAWVRSTCDGAPCMRLLTAAERARNYAMRTGKCVKVGA